MDYDDERNALYVHAIDGGDYESVVDPIRTWEDLALRMFDESRDPGDPVPDPDQVAAERAEDDGSEDPPSGASDASAGAGGETDGE